MMRGMGGYASSKAQHSRETHRVRRDANNRDRRHLEQVGWVGMCTMCRKEVCFNVGGAYSGLSGKQRTRRAQVRFDTAEERAQAADNSTPKNVEGGEEVS